MAKDEGDDLLPDKDAAKGFYAKYEPKEILGRGISSTVRRCIEKETGIEYAAKIIDISNESQESADGITMQEATMQEVHILRRVAGHPYIIELHDVFESNTFIFLIFEICKNGELFDYLTSVVTLSEKKTRYIMRQVFEGVQHVHNQGIVHRDLKPENILLDDNLDVKITDFGFARMLKPGDKLYDLCGTPGYLAPEVLKCNMFENAEGYGYEVDIWACGVIMFTLLVGCPPFWHRKQMVMLRNIMEGKYSFTSPEWADITEAPKDLIKKLLVVDPQKRITIKEALDHSFFHTVCFDNGYRVDFSTMTQFLFRKLMGNESAASLKYTPVLWDQDIAPLKRSLSSNSRRLSRISQLALELKAKSFDARKRFQLAIICVRAVIRIKRLHTTPEPLSTLVAQTDPYRIKILRKVIDGCAFRVYGHWVKKGEGQNRAALFENTAKTELKHLYVTNLSR